MTPRAAKWKVIRPRFLADLLILFTVRTKTLIEKSDLNYYQLSPSGGVVGKAALLGVCLGPFIVSAYGGGTATALPRRRRGRVPLLQVPAD